MAFSPFYAALEAYIDIPFNLHLSLILVVVYGLLTRRPSILLVAVYVVSAVIVRYDTTSSPKEMTKTMALLPLGLGSVLAFLVAPRPAKLRALPYFEPYVNFAVYGNIGMMVFTPAGDTLRGLCTKVACLGLFAWILLQGWRCGWRTMQLHDRLLVFTAVSRSWILAHAVYRFVLLTLPVFGSGRRHRLMEVYSLAMTFALSSASDLPFEYCFGMADTVVVPAASAWARIATTFELIPKDDKSGSGIGTAGDVCLSAVVLGVAGFAAWNVARLRREGKANVGKGLGHRLA